MTTRLSAAELRGPSLQQVAGRDAAIGGRALITPQRWVWTRAGAEDRQKEPDKVEEEEDSERVKLTNANPEQIWGMCCYFPPLQVQ